MNKALVQFLAQRFTMESLCACVALTCLTVGHGRAVAQPASVIPATQDSNEKLSIESLPSSDATEASRPRGILILNSYRSDTRYTQVQVEAIRRALYGSRAFRFQFFLEYLDVLQDSDERFFISLSAWYQERYENRSVDLIITTDSPALKFALVYGDAAFPGVPIVFSAASNAHVLSRVDPVRATGVVESVDVSGTLKLALQLQPNLRRIIFLTDHTQHSKFLESRARAVIDQFADRIEFQWQLGGTSAEIVQRLNGMGDESAVCLLANYNLANRVPGGDKTQIQHLCEASPVPIYALFDSYLKHGVLGGVVASGEAQGRAAAQLALRVLKGEPVSRVPMIQDSPNVAMVNWSAMKRWDIRESRLPPDAVIKRRVPSVFEQYGWYIVAAAACCLLEAGIISLLLFNVIRRRRVERDLGEQRALLNEIINHVPHAVFWKDRNSVYQGGNLQYARDVGFQSPDEVVGKTDYDIHTNADLIRDYRESDRAVVEKRQPILNELQLQRFASGDIGSVLVSKAPLFDEQGEVRGVLGVYTDVTRMKQEEARLSLLNDIATNITSSLPVEDIIRQTVDKVAQVFPGIRVSYSTVDPSGRLEVVISRQPQDWASISGIVADLRQAPRYLAALRAGQPVILSDLKHEPPETDACAIFDLNITRAVLDVPIRCVDGLVGILGFCSPVPREWSEDELATLMGITTHFSVAIQESKARAKIVDALASLRESEARFHAFMDNCPIIAFIKDLEGRLVYANPAMEERFRLKVSDWKGKSDAELWPPATATQFRENDLGVLASGTLAIVEEIIEFDGEIQYWTSYKFAIRDASNRLYLAGMSVETTHQRRVEQSLKDANEQLERRVLERTAELKESEERFQELSNAAFEGIAIHEDGRILAANPALAEMFGYELSEIIGLTRRELVAPQALRETRDELRATIAGGGDEVQESIGLRRSGETFPIELRGKWVPYLGRLVRVSAIRDISGRKQAEQEKLRHQAELAHILRRVTLDELASGLAHELNQPLAAISNYTSAALRRLRDSSSPGPEIAEAMSLVAEQSERAAQIIRRVRAFARKSEANRTTADLNTIVKNALRLVEHEINQNAIDCVCNLAVDLPPVIVDSIQIEQVIINLIKNACDALERTPVGKGRIVISTGLVDDKVELSVIDNGPGVSPQAAADLFKPFSTTKDRGVGLGLSISRGIVEAHGGRLQFRSCQDGRTAFEFQLPIGKPARLPQTAH